MPTVPADPPSVPAGPSTTEGVSAMIPVANITLEDALLDNPNFRANIKLFEGQVFFIENWLVALQRSMNLFTEEWKRLNEVTSVLNKRAEVPLLSQGMLSSQYTIPAMKLVGGAFRTTLALKSKYITEVNEKVLKPLDDFLKTELKDFKEEKKLFDKALEKYESTLSKYNGQSRQKEASALREEAFQLYDTRKAYIQAAMSCSMLCIKFQDSLDQLVLGVFLDLIATQHDYFSGNADHFGSMALQVLQLKTYMRNHREASAIAVAELEQNKERYTNDAVEYWKPSRSLKCYSNTVSPPKSTIGSTIGHAALGPVFAAQMAGQVPMSTLMSRPATISQFSTTGTNRTPLQISHFQSQPTLSANSASLSTGSAPPSSTQSNPSEILSSVDTLSVPLAGSKSSNHSTSSLPALNTLHNLSNSSNQSLANSFVADQSMEFTPTTKQGYLNIRIPQPKNRAPVWQRKYFFIQEGEFGFESVVSNPTVGSQVVQSERIAVLLCEVRYGSSSNSLLTLSGGGNPSSGSQGLAMVQMERRFCFEVVCATQSYLLQAETEDDLMSWVNTFEAAKRDVFLQQNLPRHIEPEEPYSPMVPDNDLPSFSFSPEDLMGKSSKAMDEPENGEVKRPGGSLGLGWAASVPGVSLLLGSYAGSTSGTEKGSSNEEPETLGSISNTAGKSSLDADEDGQNKEAQLESSQDQSVAGSQQTRENTPLPPAMEAEAVAPSSRRSASESAGNMGSSGHSHQLSEIERLMTSSLHLVPKAAPMAVSEISHYPMELVVRNRELHLRFHGTKVHSKEYVLHSWTSGYIDDSRPAKPMTVYGRIYLTQSGMYFYARGLSVEMKRMYRFSAIRGIECEQKDISTEWRIETMDGVRHVFSQFTLTDTEYQVLHLIWTNVHQEKERLPVKELFRRTMLITNKPRGSAGSGSLAETESSHQTTRGGTLAKNAGAMIESPGGADSAAASIRTIDEPWSEHPSDAEDLPEGAEVPSGSVACNCPGHLEKVELEQTFKISAKTLNRLLFSTDSPIWKEFHERRSNTVQSVSEWASSGRTKSRTVKFLMVVNNPLVKLNETDCVESQTCEVEENGVRYSYTVRSSVLAMPYSDAFTPVLRYCITFVSKNECKLTFSSGIEWHKSPLVKAMIKGAIIKGTQETIRDVTEIIQTHLERRKEHSRQHSGAISTPNEPGSHSRSDSAKITISLRGPDEDVHSILLDPVNEGDVSDFASGNPNNDSRVPGARRHTVSAAAGSGGVMYSGPRVQGRWPTGSQPTFVPVGSKASRTKLLGRPTRSTLLDDDAASDGQARAGTGAKQESSKSTWSLGGLAALVAHKDESGKLVTSTKWLYCLLLVSSIINVWAAYNSQKMLTSAWRLKEHGVGSQGALRGYPEPVHRVLNQYRRQQILGDSASHDGRRNVRVAARAVYLKDLEEQMLSGTLEGMENEQSIDRRSFEVFLEVRDSFRSWSQPPLEWFTDQNGSQSQPASSTSLTPVPQPTYGPGSAHGGAQYVSKYPWLLPQHQRWATKLIFQRDRVGILRHDLLTTFEALKQLERRLLETEYVNWIMDERCRCRLWDRQRKARLARSTNDPAAPTLVATPKDGHEEEPETDGALDVEKAKRRLLHQDKAGFSSPDEIDDDDVRGEDEDQEVYKRRLTNARIAREFCEGLEHQVELFMEDSSV